MTAAPFIGAAVFFLMNPYHVVVSVFDYMVPTLPWHDRVVVCPFDYMVDPLILTQPCSRLVICYMVDPLAKRYPEVISTWLHILGYLTM